jgi:hypothetical protein
MPSNEFVPFLCFITNITNDQECVVTFSIAHSFFIGEIVSFRVNTAYGMKEINNQRAQVLSSDEFTITTDLDTLSYTPFVFPGSVTISNYNSVNLLLNYQPGITVIPGTINIAGGAGNIFTDPNKDGSLLKNGLPSLARINYETGILKNVGLNITGTFSIQTTQAVPNCVPVSSGQQIGQTNFNYNILSDAFDNIRIN